MKVRPASGPKAAVRRSVRAGPCVQPRHVQDPAFRTLAFSPGRDAASSSVSDTWAWARGGGSGGAPASGRSRRTRPGRVPDRPGLGLGAPAKLRGGPVPPRGREQRKRRGAGTRAGETPLPRTSLRSRPPRALGQRGNAVCWRPTTKRFTWEF